MRWESSDSTYVLRRRGLEVHDAGFIRGVAVARGDFLVLEDHRVVKLLAILMGGGRVVAARGQVGQWRRSWPDFVDVDASTMAIRFVVKESPRVGAHLWQELVESLSLREQRVLLVSEGVWLGDKWTQAVGGHLLKTPGGSPLYDIITELGPLRDALARNPRWEVRIDGASDAPLVLVPRDVWELPIRDPLVQDTVLSPLELVMAGLRQRMATGTLAVAVVPSIDDLGT